MRALPEFTAEASIYRSVHQYRSVAASPFRGAAVPVEFAQESCLPQFTSCIPDPDSPTGCSRCRIMPDCSEICGLQCTCPAPPPPRSPSTVAPIFVRRASRAVPLCLSRFMVVGVAHQMSSAAPIRSVVRMAASAEVSLEPRSARRSELYRVG